MPVYTRGSRHAPSGSLIGEASPFGDFIAHIGILGTGAHVSQDCDVKVLHMVGDVVTTDIKMQLVGWLLDLSENQRTRIVAFAEREFNRTIHARYLASPSNRRKYDPDTNTDLYTAYSCAGFVCACYRDIDIELIVSDDHLPRIEIDVLRQIWRLPDNLAVLRGIGLKMGTDWHILLPSYLFHAIRHADEHGKDKLPYKPTIADISLPTNT